MSDETGDEPSAFFSRRRVIFALIGAIPSFFGFWWTCNEFLQLCPPPFWINESTRDTSTPEDGDTNTSPQAGFDYSPEEPEVGEEVRFDASKSHDPDSEIVVHTWMFATEEELLRGEGETDEGERVTHVFDTQDTYIVILTVRTDDGQRAERRKPVPVSGGGLPVERRSSRE